MIVYHGSSEIVDAPDVLHSYRPLDFGMGFYVTTLEVQAARWARRKTALLGKGKAFVNRYQMEENTDSFRVKTFYDQIAFITQRAIDGLLVYDSCFEVL